VLSYTTRRTRKARPGLAIYAVANAGAIQHTGASSQLPGRITDAIQHSVVSI
jgi:hypothetical protein